MSKGSAARPFSVSDDVFTEAYCRTFGHKVREDRCMNCGAKPEGSPEGEPWLKKQPENER
jgi:hypothetical protein